MTVRRTLAILAVGVLGGIGMSQGFAHSHQSTSSTRSATAGSVHPGYEKPTGFAQPTGDTVNDLLTGLDAITEAQIAAVTTTDGPDPVAAIQSLRQQHDDVRTLVLTHYYGWLPYPLPPSSATSSGKVAERDTVDTAELTPGE
jgi:hypothetical protein